MASSLEGSSLSGKLSLDEGGLRCLTDDGGVYLPFDLVADVEVRTHLLRATSLVLVGTHGERREIHVEGQVATVAQRAILEALIGRRIDRRASIAVLNRGSLPLVEWLRAAAGDRAGYRDGVLDLDLVLAAFEDARTAQDERAASAFVLLERAEESELTRVMAVFLERLVPPIVIVAARMARGGEALVPDDVLADACIFLGDQDRAALDEAIRTPSSTADIERVRQSLQRAGELLRARRVDEKPAPEHKLRGVMRGTHAALQPARWIGRSWGI